MNLTEFINKKREGTIDKIEKRLETENLKFDFIEMLVKKNHKEITDYLEKYGFAHLEDIYDIGLQISYLFKELNESGKTGRHFSLSICDEIPENNLANYLPVKLGLFFIPEGGGNFNQLELTEKGKEIKKKYFENEQTQFNCSL